MRRQFVHPFDGQIAAVGLKSKGAEQDHYGRHLAQRELDLPFAFEMRRQVSLAPTDCTEESGIICDALLQTHNLTLPSALVGYDSRSDLILTNQREISAFVHTTKE